MLLVEVELAGAGNGISYVSLDGWALEHNYKPRIINFSRTNYSIPSDHGGFAQPQFGSITFMPLLFMDNWPPPISFPIAFFYTDTIEADRVELFRGTAYIYSYDRVGMTYSLYGPVHNEVVPEQTIYSGALTDIISSILLLIPEITSVNVSLARDPSPDVSYTTSGTTTLALNLTSNIAQFYSHLIYIVGMVAYLVDMKTDNGTLSLEREYDYIATPKYSYKTPISVLRAGDFSQSSIYPYGTESSVTPYHTDQSVIETALADILAIENTQRVSLEVPMIAANFPVHGQRISLIDTSNVENIALDFRARKIQYDFMGLKINIEGEVAA